MDIKSLSKFHFCISNKSKLWKGVLKGCPFFQIVLATLATLAVAEIYEDRQYYQYRGPPAPLNNDGMVMDTPEVAHARAAHLAMHAETVDRLRKAQDDYEMYENNEMSYLSPPMMDEPMMPKRQRQRMFAPSARDERMMGTPEVST